MSKLVRSFLIINLSEIIFVLSGYFIHAYLGRLFNPADYGRYGLIVALATMTIVFIGDGIPKALSKYISQYPEKEKIIKRKAAIIQLILITGVSITYYLCAPLLASFFRDESLVELIKLSTFIIPAFAVASFYNNYFNGLRMFGMQAVQRSIRSAARIVAILSLAYFYGIKGAIVGYIAAPAIVALFSFFADSHRKKPILGNFPSKKIIKFGLGIVGFMVAYNLVINIDLFLVKILIESDYWVGIYNAVITIGRIPFYFFSTLAFILLPTISNILEKQSSEKARQLIKKSMRYLLMLIIPSVATIIIYSREIITLLYSDRYSSGDFALKVFVAGIGALTIFYICAFILNGSGKVKASAYLAWAGLALNVFLNYLFIPQLGILGSALATTITSFILMIVSLILVRKTFGTFLNFLSLARFIFATLVTSGIFYFLPKSTLLMFPEGVAFFIVYFLILSVTREMNGNDRQRLKDLFSKKL